jgi:transcription termination/antitermination protein NusA
MNKELFAALDSLEKEKGISKEILFEALEVALISAYKRNFQSAPAVRVSIDRDTGEIQVFSQLRVVEHVEAEQQEVSLYEARVYDPRCQIDDVVEMEVTPQEFGRIAAQTAKQVVIQRIREAERELIYENFVDRTEEIITGLVRRFEQRNVIIDLGRTEAVLPVDEQIPHERYRQGERVKTFIVDVKKTTKGPQIIVSRTHTGFLKRLFEMEVPEIYEGIVEIKAAAREAGYRSKLAVFSNNKDIDPVGACVGPKGSRVQAISNELKGEKIDIIKWSEVSEEYIANALSPAKVSSVILNSEQKTATVVVPDTQLSLAIGKEGQNARLSAKITGWKIDISSETQFTEKSLSAIGLSDPDAEEFDQSPAEETPVTEASETREPVAMEELAEEVETVADTAAEEIVEPAGEEEKESKPKKKPVKAKTTKKEKKRKAKSDPEDEVVEEMSTDD